MKLLFFLLLTSFCISVNAQHWPTYRFQHDSIYKNARVKSFQWKKDSTKTTIDFEVNLDTNGRITKIQSNDDPTVFFEYDQTGKLIAESDWDGDAVFTYDDLGRVRSKTVYYGDKTIARKDSISYNPKIIKSYKYDEDGKFVKKKEYYFDSETTVKKYVFATPSSYGDIAYNYHNVFNSKGQITQTTNMTMVGQAFYHYHQNGLLNTVTITHSIEQAENAPPIIQQLIYTYY